MNKKNSIDLNCILSKSEKFIERHLKDKFVIKNLKKNEFFIFENVSYDIYKLIDGKNTIEKMGLILSQEYDINYNTLMKDVFDFISDLIENDIVLVKQ